MNKTVFITGSSTGIGKSTALAFAKEQYNVVVTYYNNKTQGEQVAKDYQKQGATDVLLVNLNVMNNQSITGAISKIKSTFGDVDVLVNNAGVCNWTTLEKLSMEDIETEIRTNLEGLIKVTRVAIPYISTTIINIASQAGLRSYAAGPVYQATKWGVRGFTKALALEYPNLNIYAVNPQGTATRMNNFSGDAPGKVAEIIVKLTKKKTTQPSGADINVWDYYNE